jgi:hypothetical protein
LSLTFAACYKDLTVATSKVPKKKVRRVGGTPRRAKASLNFHVQLFDVDTETSEMSLEWEGSVDALAAQNSDYFRGRESTKLFALKPGEGFYMNMGAGGAWFVLRKPKSMLKFKA